LNTESRIFVAGGRTLIGAAILRQLDRLSYGKLVGRPGEEPNLANFSEVESFFLRYQPEYVFLVAGKSGGINANQKYPAELMLDNLRVECAVIHHAYLHNVRKLIYLASSCSYPRMAPQPMKEEYLMTGLLEPTNEAYAMAKLAGICLCKAYRQQYGANFISVVPANGFGPDDDFSLEESHVIPALIRRMHEAKVQGLDTVEIWGTGSARREFVLSDDLAEGCIFVMRECDEPGPINIGGGADVSIRELAQIIKEVVGFAGELKFDCSKPDGMPYKALDASRLGSMGWSAKTPLRKAISLTYDWFVRTAA
jgi:GDP-L-fucose synthase